MSKNILKNVTSEDFVKLRFPNSPATDGTKCVFSIRGINEKTNQYQGALFLKILEEDNYHQFTSGTHYDTSPKFSPSGEFLAFISSRSGKGMQVYVMPTTGGEALEVTTFPKGIIDYTWSHDSKSIHVTARVNKKELEAIINPKLDETPSNVLNPAEFSAYKAKKESQEEMNTDPRVITEAYCRMLTFYLDGRFIQPFVIPIPNFSFDEKEKEKEKIVHVGEFGYHYTLGTFSLDDDNVYIFRYSEDPSISMKQELLRVSISEMSSEKLMEAFARWIQQVNLSPDGRYVSFEGLREDKGAYDDVQIFLYDTLADKKSEIICITKDYNRSVIQSQWFDSQTLFFLSPADGKINIHKINIDTGEVTLIAGGDRNINSFGIFPNKNRIVYSVSHYSYPSDIFWSDLEGKNEERITEVNEEFLNTHNIAKSEEFSFEREGTQFQGWILTPRDHNSEEKLPVVLEIHGGPAAMWSSHEITLWHEWNVLVGQKNAVVFCNPRGSDGYGAEFRGAVHANWGHLPANDILQGLDTALEKFSYLDKNRVAVTGGSYGGYMTAWLATTQSNRFKAAVSQRGVYEFLNFGMTTDIAIWMEFQYKGELLDQFSEFWNDQPMVHIKKLQTPLLIIHSDNDFRVPIGTAEQLFWLGKRYGKIIELVRYPRDGHELSRSGEPRHIIDRINRTAGWIKKYNT
ncbi:MAG: prolyl oligopeptidase family serine peptidase, partial [Candidatus Hodarchaeales archaeon]